MRAQGVRDEFMDNFKASLLERIPAVKAGSFAWGMLVVCKPLPGTASPTALALADALRAAQGAIGLPTHGIEGPGAALSPCPSGP